MNFHLILLLFFLTVINFSKSHKTGEKPEIDELQPVPPSIKVGQKTFYAQTFFTASWFRAIQFCRYYGMELASIDNQEENEGISKNWNQTGFVNRYWTSGQNWAQNDTWVWLSNGNTAIYQNWIPGDPNNESDTGEDEHCIEIKFISGEYQWNDLRCSFPLYFICEKSE